MILLTLLGLSTPSLALLSPTIWDVTKKGAEKIGLISIRALSKLASKIADNIISDPTTIAKIAGLLLN